ncbi:MAG TPA: peptidoglycan-binding domain-containing protein [Anoxybacillus sp.]|jgi:hypothetical protein|nr:peptidoglycan-binding domain-containing protein [Anoxybacillus sp.]
MKKLQLITLSFLLSFSVLFITQPHYASAHAMSDNWANNDTVGYGHVTSGGYVYAVQRMLKDTSWGYSDVDGYWGSKTYNGVVAFQKNEGISADGLVGPVTWGEFQDYMVYAGTNGGSGRYYKFSYNISDSYPAKYYRDACYGWYIDRTLTNTGDYWKVDHGFSELTYICL